jgi:hypothetical protein
MTMNFSPMKESDMKTRPCTPVIFRTLARDLNLRLACRQLDIHYEHSLMPFKPDMKMKKEEIEDILTGLIKDEKQKAKGDREGENRPAVRKDKVNLLRLRLSVLITENSCQSFRSLAAAAGCDPSTARSVSLQIVLCGGPRPYDYNNQHSQAEFERLDDLISDPGSLYFTAQDYKRRAPSFSKKFIRKRLKESGRKYKKLGRQRKNPQERKFNPKELKKVIWTVVQAMAKGDDTILFLDEAVFPCNQTSDRCWLRKDQEAIYNRRESSETLSAIALCSQSGFVAFQVHSAEINKQAIHFFLTQVLSRIDKGKKLVVLLDNAGWHQSNLILKSGMRELLLFNVAYCWESNLIENTFSKMKSLWRTRRVAKNIEEEVESLVEVFRSSWAKDAKGDFEGYRRQYYRQLTSLLQHL